VLFRCSKNRKNFFTSGSVTSYLIILRLKQDGDQILAAYDFNNVMSCSDFKGLIIVIRNYVRDVTICEHLQSNFIKTI
jgi:hypothetical protein